MLHIHLITLGKLKESYWQAAEAEYLKRLHAFAKVTIHELREESFSEKDKPELIKERESEKIKIEIGKIKDAYVIILDENGKEFSSPQLAEHLNNLTTKQFNNVVFVIGGPLGLHPDILKLGNLNLSLSKLTFTHQMARVFLLEQLYRVMMIANNRRYHY